jgi:hypothetical protein
MPWRKRTVLRGGSAAPGAVTVAWWSSFIGRI